MNGAIRPFPHMPLCHSQGQIYFTFYYVQLTRKTTYLGRSAAVSELYCDFNTLGQLRYFTFPGEIEICKSLLDISSFFFENTH